MPRFLLTLTADESSTGDAAPPALYGAIGASAQRWSDEGVLLDTGGLAPTAMGTRLSLSTGEITATEGPFSDAKEPVTTAYAIIRVSDHQEAVRRATEFLEIHKQHWPGWEGGSEIRQIFGADGDATP